MEMKNNLKQKRTIVNSLLTLTILVLSWVSATHFYSRDEHVIEAGSVEDKIVSYGIPLLSIAILICLCFLLCVVSLTIWHRLAERAR
jgi:hypothetical protein